METAHHSILPEALEVTECAPIPDTEQLYYKRQSNDTQKLMSGRYVYTAGHGSISRLVPGVLTAAAEIKGVRWDASDPASITVAPLQPLYCVPR